jgi:[protein-PII] uridylyltransferase
VADYLERARGVFKSLVGGQRPVEPVDASRAEVVGDNLAVATGRVTFVDPARAAAEPQTWLAAFTAAAIRNIPVSDEALAVIESHATEGGIATLMRLDGAGQMLELLHPRPGLSQRLDEMRRCGLLGRILPELPALRPPMGRSERKDAEPVPPIAAVEGLERLLTDATLSAQRFGAMLRELDAPEILVLTLLVRDSADATSAQQGEGVGPARAAGDRLRLQADTIETIEFLSRHQKRMQQVTYRQDTGDPDIVRSFASIFKTEEQLKMLCLMTVADRRLGGGSALTPWKAELLWRLYVDAYNQLTMAYGDEVIDATEASLTTLHANRPAGVSDDELTTFLEGFPKRYLTLFEPHSIYEHVDLCRKLGPDEVHYFLRRKDDAWEITVVTLDKPYLFSNICGVLSYLDLDIVRGRALTSLKSVVIDVFQFIDRTGSFEAARLDPLLQDVASGRVDITALLREKKSEGIGPAGERMPPVIYFDNEASHRYSILEIVADDSPGLLYRISRAISGYGCDVELVLISTEGHRAVDVFHLIKADGKLTDSDQLALTESLERSLGSHLQDEGA